jgi:DNA-directed RNA polymerase specialized sigma24 family protein
MSNDKNRCESRRTRYLNDLCDDELLNSVRAGDIDAFGELYERYAIDALRWADQVLDSRNDSEDLVSEAFTALLERLLSDGAPILAFWPDLQAQMRHAMHQSTTAIEGSFGLTPDTVGSCLSDVQLDSARRQRELSLVAAAFNGLAKKWQVLLRRLVIEGQSFDTVATALRLNSALVATMASTATESLCLAYLQAHIPPVRPADCRDASSRIPRWIFGRLPEHARQQLSRHTANCSWCALVTVELLGLRARMPDVR